VRWLPLERACDSRFNSRPLWLRLLVPLRLYDLPCDDRLAELLPVLLLVVVEVVVVVLFVVVDVDVLLLRLSASALRVAGTSLFFQDPPSRVFQLSPFFRYTEPCLSVYTLFLLSTEPGLLYEDLEADAAVRDL
jgi:hypothetical protein